MCRNEQLTSSSVRQFIALQLAADIHGVFGPEINAAGAVAVVALDNDSFRFDRKRGKLFLPRCGLGIVARVNADFYLRVEARVDIRGRVDASGRRNDIVNISSSSSS